jgi:hypothetical protein
VDRGSPNSGTRAAAATTARTTAVFTLLSIDPLRPFALRKVRAKDSTPTNTASHSSRARNGRRGHFSAT